MPAMNRPPRRSRGHDADGVVVLHAIMPRSGQRVVSPRALQGATACRASREARDTMVVVVVVVMAMQRWPRDGRAFYSLAACSSGGWALLIDLDSEGDLGVKPFRLPHPVVFS